MKHPLLKTTVWFTLTLFALLSIGAVRQQRAFITRGIPAGSPQPIIPHTTTQLGYNVHLTHLTPSQLDTTLTAISATGVTHLKQTFPHTPNFDWETTDSIITATTTHGLTLVPLLDGDPAQNYAPPAQPAQFATWANEFATRYADQLTYYIIWDEPNLASHWGNQNPNPSEYSALLTATATAIRQADPNAVIVSAPLAPTSETGPQNYAEPLFLQQMLEAGAAPAFDIVAGKPYGFDTAPADRRVSLDTLNFSRIILLRETLTENGLHDKAVWAGNWGWNSLPAGWQGQPSIWGQTDPQTQAAHTLAGLQRAQQEWPWMGLMFLENWEPAGTETNPSWGFSIANRPTAQAITHHHNQPQTLAYPGFHPAQPGASQQYSGTWRFSPQFGADISQTGDTATLHFWGTDIALRVRRADFRARLYVTLDGQPTNALPHDGQGTTLVLTAPDPAQDYLSTEIVAHNLQPGPHTLTISAWRGWDQWALNGYSVSYQPPATPYHLTLLALALLATTSLIMTMRSAQQVNWLTQLPALTQHIHQLNQTSQLWLTAGLGTLVALTGWLTWGQQAAGLYRRLGDLPQLALTAAAASVFYVTPSFIVYVTALLLLFLLIYARPVWGIALIAATLPLYVQPKPILNYRFSPVEIFLLLTCLATLLSHATTFLLKQHTAAPALRWPSLKRLSPISTLVLALFLLATLATLFAARQDVATNEWRTVFLEPFLFYILLRTTRIKDKEMWLILEAFLLSGLIVALYGLGAYVMGENIITVAGGLGRLRSFFGSPNNVALYLGRIWPFLAAMGLMGRATPRRRLVYALALLPVGLAMLLTFSKGAFFLGIPAGTLILLILWRKQQNKPIWPWLIPLGGLSLIALLIALNIPALASRLSLQGATSFLRLNLWQASLNMFLENPLLGVGPDNFLYAYRGRYILDAAWQEPYLNHPHNFPLDLATRLGLGGLLIGLALLANWLKQLYQHVSRPIPPPWQPVLVGLTGAVAHLLIHGLVDHSFFITDLAYSFYFLLALTQWLTQKHKTNAQTDNSSA